MEGHWAGGDQTRSCLAYLMDGGGIKNICLGWGDTEILFLEVGGKNYWRGCKAVCRATSASKSSLCCVNMRKCAFSGPN